MTQRSRFDQAGQDAVKKAKATAEALFKRASRIESEGKIAAEEIREEAAALVSAAIQDGVDDLLDANPSIPRNQATKEAPGGWRYYLREGIVAGIQWEPMAKPSQSGIPEPAKVPAKAETPEEELARLTVEHQAQEVAAELAATKLLEKRRELGLEPVVEAGKNGESK